ncbi:MAG: NADPH-dependent FMN reductase [Vulcanimicrobiaceae bacterium]
MNILAICGSLQERSSNMALLRAAQRLAPGDVTVSIHSTIGEIPHFNSDMDAESPPRSVRAFRAAIASADAVLIATPEYAFEMPGSLKNALDWIVGSGELTGKPVAVMSSSPTLTGGVRAQMALVQTLGVMSADIVDTLTVPSVKQKLNESGELDHDVTIRRISDLLQSLATPSSP